MDRRGVARKHLRFRDILAELPARSLLVLNDTRVLAARLRGRKPTGGAVEFLLTQRMGNDQPAGGRQNDRFCELWDGLTRGLSGAASVGAIDLRTLKGFRTSRDEAAAAKPPSPHAFDVGGDVSVEIVERRDAGRALLRLTGPGPSLLAVLDGIGEVPLPPYIEAARRRLGDAAPAVDDRARYQTVYAARAGRGRRADRGAALHARAARRRSRAPVTSIATLTLDVGPGTFRPVEVDDPRAHRLDSERYQIPADAADAIARARRERRPVVAVGTTVVRALEASARRARGRSRGGRRGDRPLPAARRRLPGRHGSDHQLPPAAIDAADAGRGVRREGERPRPRTARRSNAAIGSTATGTRC